MANNIIQSPFPSMWNGEQIDNSVNRALNAVLVSDIQATLGDQLDKPISQKTVTELFKRTPEWYEMMPIPSAQYLTKLAFLTINQGSYLAGHIYQCLQNQQGVYFWKDILPLATVSSVNGMSGDVVLTASDVNAATIESLVAETDARILADETLQNNIDNIKSIKILNKGVIVSTTENVQTTCTNYIVTEYSRQPQHLDGLVVTLTDSVPPNQKEQYMYSIYSNMWIDLGSTTVDISDASYTEKGILKIKQNTGLSILNAELSIDDTIALKSQSAEAVLYSINWTNRENIVQIPNTQNYTTIFVSASQNGTIQSVLENQKQLSNTNIYKITSEDNTHIKLFCETTPSVDLNILVTLGG